MLWLRVANIFFKVMNILSFIILLSRYKTSTIALDL